MSCLVASCQETVTASIPVFGGIPLCLRHTLQLNSGERLRFDDGSLFYKTTEGYNHERSVLDQTVISANMADQNILADVALRSPRGFIYGDFIISEPQGWDDWPLGPPEEKK